MQNVSPLESASDSTNDTIQSTSEKPKDALKTDGDSETTTPTVARSSHTSRTDLLLAGKKGAHGLSPLAAQLAAQSTPSSPLESHKSRIAGISGSAESLKTGNHNPSALARGVSSPKLGASITAIDSNVMASSASIIAGPPNHVAAAYSVLSSQWVDLNPADQESIQKQDASESSSKQRINSSMPELSITSTWTKVFRSKVREINNDSALNVSNAAVSTDIKLTDPSTILFDPKYLAEATALLPKTMDSKPVDPRNDWSLLRIRKLAQMESIVVKFADLAQTSQQKKRLLSMARLPSAITGQELVDWFMLNCKFLVRDEALRYAQEFMDWGYIISVDLNEKFEPTTSQYVIQIPSLWITRIVNPRDFDYAVYLLRRGLRNSVKEILKFYEEERLEQMHKSQHKVWGDVIAKVEKDTTLLNGMKSNDRKLLRLQEFGFWRMHKPAPNTTSKLIESGSDSHKGKRQTENEYFGFLSAAKQLVFFERRLEQLQASLNQNRVKASVSCKSIIQRCKVFMPVDPFFTQVSNRWITDDSTAWGATSSTPTAAEARVWCYSFKDLLSDPLGMKCFDEFLAKEFSQENLYFYQRCIEIENLPAKDEFVKGAKQIYNIYIKVGSPHEININANTRSTLSAIFEPPEGADSVKRVPTDCFDDAVDHVFALMAKDSYARFCNSELIQTLLRSVSISASDT